MDRRLAQRPLDGQARYGKSAAGALLLIGILHPAARQARRGKKILLERHVYSHRCHRVRQASGVGVTINMALLREVRQEKLGCSEGESPSRLMEASVFRTKEMNGKV